MGFLDILKTSAAGLSAQRLRMKLIASNMANANTTRTAEGGPYRRKDPVFAAVPREDNFKKILNGQTAGSDLTEVKVIAISQDTRPPILKYDPGHPDANPQGYVAMPNINVIEEMVNMISATRSYEANVTAVRATKEMAMDALDIGR